MRLSEIESALREHPGVRDAAVVFRESNPGEREVVGYIVPDAAYLESFLSGTEEEQKRLQKWRKTFDLMQFGKDANSSALAFNIAGWNSSYTRQPIPAEQMREWVDESVKEILALRPSEILEIGCGTGLLLLRIAPGCKRYVATDFSGAVLQRLKEQMAKLERPLDGVSLFERTADNFEGFAPDSFDTVVINSVIQHFPSVTYLVRVLERMLEVVRPGGKIFFGDVRSLSLLNAYAASVELFQAPPAMNLAELRERVLRRANHQEQLVVSPAFFLALQRRFPKISRVEIRPRRGCFDNELNRFRFNATLSIGHETGELFEPAWQEWPAAGMTIEAIRRMLEKPGCTTLALRSVPNARIERDISAANEIARDGGARTAADLRASLQKTETRGVDPQALWNLADDLGFFLDLSWASSREDGSFDLLFRRMPHCEPPPRFSVAWPVPASPGEDLLQHANTPGQRVLSSKLIQELIDFSKQKFSPSAVPSAFVLMDAIPLQSNGELNYEALPRPEISQS
jgi:SAM-dependent methyltransferase